MPRPPRYKPRDISRRRTWIYLVVIAFVFVDIVLISWALGSRSPATQSAPAPIPTFSPLISATPTPTATPIDTVPPIRVLSALDGETAWRATTGECPTATATPEVTTDSGDTWRATNATGEVGVTALQSLRVVSDSMIELVGFDGEECAPQFVRSFVAGADYSAAPNLLDDQWYVDPIARETVHSPAGDVNAPCDAVVALAVRSVSEGALLCADSQAFTSTDSGVTWSNPVTIDGAVNLAVTAVGYVIATVGLPECAGVQLIALSVGPTTVTPTGCLPVDEPAETMQGRVAISEAAGTVWVWAGDSVRRSTDQGTTWQ